MPTLGLGAGLSPVRKRIFMPSDISGLKLWFDAADTGTITHTGGAVDQWSDKSGNGNHAAESGASRPTTASRTVNGRNAIDFDGTQRLVIADSADFDHEGGGYTLITVSVIDTFANNAGWLVSKFQNNLGEELRYYGNTTYNMAASYGTSATANTILGTYETPVDGEAFIGGVVYDDGGAFDILFGRGDPVQNALGISIPESTQQIYLGNVRGTGEYLEGAFCEVLYFNRRLSLAELDQIGNYLRLKWNVTWHAQNRTELTAGTGQSNMSRWFFTTLGYDNDGRDAYLDGLSSYFDETLIFNGAYNQGGILQSTDLGSDVYWISDDLSDGPALSALISGWDTNNLYTIDYVDSFLWCGGDTDIMGLKNALTDKATLKAANQALFERFRELATYTSDPQIIAALPGIYTSADFDEAQTYRDILLELAAENAWLHLVETHDATLSDSAHRDVAGNELVAGRMAEKLAFARAKRSKDGTLGPIITSASYSGATVTAQVELDNGAAITGSEVDQFRIEDDGTPVTISSFSVDGAVITFTLSSAIAAGSTVALWCNYGRGINVTQANLVKDSNGMVMRSVSALSVSEA